MLTIPGIDVSSNNGVINWKEVAGFGIKFAFIKATEGITVIDPQFKANWQEARENGIICSPYHFFHPGDDPQTTARVFMDTVGVLEANDLPPCLDFEVLDKSSVFSATYAATSWLQLIDVGLKKTPIVYSDLGFFEELKLPQSFSQYPLYQAELSTTPKVASPWKDISFWQYSWTGKVPGISTNVDMDVFYGTIQQLQKLCLG